MSYTAQDVDEIVKKLRMDLSAAQGKITELKNALASFDLPRDEPAFACKHNGCGLPFRSEQRLSEHLENVHGVRQVPPAPPGLGISETGTRSR